MEGLFLQSIFDSRKGQSDMDWNYQAKAKKSRTSRLVQDVHLDFTLTLPSLLSLSHPPKTFTLDSCIYAKYILQDLSAFAFPI